MASQQSQYLDSIQKIIDEQKKIYGRGTSIQACNQIPETNKIPIESSDKPWHWLKIPQVICVFVDMKGSTRLSANRQDKTMAGIYQLFTNTAVRIFHEFEAPYIDIKGDGVFALFNQGEHCRALAATVTFKTFVAEEFQGEVKSKLRDTNISIGGHYGIDQKTVLVRKIGLKDNPYRSDSRNNEVWAGKPINMAAKLASIADTDELLVSDRYFNNFLRTNRYALCSCGCKEGEETDNYENLWKEQPLPEDQYPQFDFRKAHSLKSNWCPIHGKEYCQQLLKS